MELAETLSKYKICASCAIYTFHCCASGSKMLGPKEVSERNATSNRGTGTLLRSQNRKEENSSFAHNHSNDLRQHEEQQPSKLLLLLNMYCSQMKICEQSVYDIFCRGCCQV